MLEAVLACTIFSLAVGSLFFLLHFGFKAFAMGTERAGTQGEMEAVVTRIRADIESTTLNSVQLYDNASRNVTVDLSSGSTVFPRHILGMCALSNWSEPSNFSDVSGLPRWDRHVLYQPTLDESGSLYRVEVNPGVIGDGQGWAGFMGYVTAYPFQPPSRGTAVAGGQVLARRRLAQTLLGFSGSKQVQSVQLSIRLRGSGRKGNAGAQRSEVFEVQARISPRNRNQ